MLLSSLVIVLVASTFLVQNQYYASQVLQAGAQDNARAATELIASEIRSVMLDGVVVAGPRTLTVRTPMALAVVCDLEGITPHLHSPGGQAALDTAEVGGVARRDTLTGAWTYGNETWSGLDGNDVNSAARCLGNGADTVGARDDFHRLLRLTSLVGDPDMNDVLMFFRETTFKFQTSVMDTSSVGLFRASYGDSLLEFATGLDSSARFQYRTAAGTYVDTVTTANLGDIDVIRIIAEARKRAPTGGVDDVTAGWSVNVALRNVR